MIAWLKEFFRPKRTFGKQRAKKAVPLTDKETKQLREDMAKAKTLGELLKK